MSSRQALPLSPDHVRCISYPGSSWQRAEDGSQASQKVLAISGWQEDERVRTLLPHVSHNDQLADLQN